MTNYYDMVRSESGNDNFSVCARAICEAVGMIDCTLGIFTLPDEIPEALKSISRQRLNLLRKKDFPSYKDTRMELAECYQKGIARDVVGRVLQDLDEGMLRLEEFVEGKAALNPNK